MIQLYRDDFDRILFISILRIRLNILMIIYYLLIGKECNRCDKVNQLSGDEFQLAIIYA